MNMRLFAIGAALALAWMGSSVPAQASSDGGCPLQWKLEHRDRSACSNLAILQPGNDTRTNLMLLLQDRNPSSTKSGLGKTLFGWQELSAALYPEPAGNEDDVFGYPSRCQTNESGRDGFLKAIRASRKLKGDEGDILVSVRQAIQPDCEGDPDGLDAVANLEGIKSKEGKQFAAYLLGALSFYNGNYDQATVGFSGIVKAKPKSQWLREAALYMIARSELNRSTKDAFGRYGWFEVRKVDQGAIANAERGFQLYLKQYPDGQFTKSAKGLMRRVYWLGDDVVKLSAEYAGALQNPAERGLRTDALVAEIDNKLLPQMVRKNDAASPMLSAMVLLYRMRKPGYDYFADAELPVLTAAELEATRDRFANQPRLFEYLQAVHAFHVQKDPAKVIQMIPDDARKSTYTYLEFSRQVLRGMALEAVGDRNARGFWQQLLPGANGLGQRKTVELALAMNLEKGGALREVFASSSPIKDQTIRDILLLRTAGPGLLRQQAENSTVSEHEQNLALYTLLYKSLTRGRYSEFQSAIKHIPENAEQFGPYYGFQYEYDYGYEDDVKVPVGMFTRKMEYDDFDCPQLKQTVLTLAGNRNDAKARVCLADYLRLAGFDDYWLDDPAPKDELGGAQSQFPGEPYSRLEIYKQLIASRNTPSDVKAYALYRAVWCYGPSGNNSCGGKEVPTTQRAAWFRQLKRNHSNTRWAKQLKYYW